MLAKKSLGQNFLTSRTAINMIIASGKVTRADTVLEVGPGKGALTEALLAKAGKVIAVEKDDRLIPFLEEKFATEKKAGSFALVHADVLEFNPLSAGLEAGRYKLVANIPYYITGTFLRRFLGYPDAPSDMVLLVQKEVAERATARDGKESILSLSIKAYGTPHFIQTVKAGSFSPAPKVDSAILSIESVSKAYFSDFSENFYFSVVKAAFAGKRKMLRGTLKTWLEKRGFAASDITEKLSRIWSERALPEKIRAEDIPFDQWKPLVTLLLNAIPA